uniref:Uncharacterized protein n=1 Tax=Hyaloperonospora arabidopsidis (strain Emoy2) TaxID=559515 RepID=M4BGN8_HYAAE
MRDGAGLAYTAFHSDSVLHRTGYPAKWAKLDYTAFYPASVLRGTEYSAGQCGTISLSIHPSKS